MLAPAAVPFGSVVEVIGGYTLTAHTADVGLMATGPTLSDLLVNLTLGLRAVTFGDLSATPTRRCTIEVEADDLADLVVAWLSEVVAVAEIEALAITSVHVAEATERRAAGTLEGISHDEVELVGPPIKAVTYHSLVVRSDESGWTAEVIVDV